MVSKQKYKKLLNSVSSRLLQSRATMSKRNRMGAALVIFIFQLTFLLKKKGKKKLVKLILREYFI